MGLNLARLASHLQVLRGTAEVYGSGLRPASCHYMQSPQSCAHCLGFRHTQLRPWRGDTGPPPLWSPVLSPEPASLQSFPELSLFPLPHTTAGPDLTLFASLLVPGLLGLAFLCGSATLMLAVLGVSPGHAYSLCCINNHSAVIFSLGGKFSKGWMWFSLRTEGSCDLEPAQPRGDE